MVAALVCDSEPFLEWTLSWHFISDEGLAHCVSPWILATHAVSRRTWDTSRYLSWTPLFTWGCIRCSSGTAPRGLQLFRELYAEAPSLWGQPCAEGFYSVTGASAHRKHIPSPTSSGSVFRSYNSLFFLWPHPVGFCKLLRICSRTRSLTQYYAALWMEI